MARVGVPVEVLVAPDKFKGTFTAAAVAAAVGAGLASAGVEVSLCPVADGGEGTLDVLGGRLGLEPVAVEVSDPLSRPVLAQFGLADGVAVIEMAAASGLGLVGEAERDAMAASSAGTGELIVAALAQGAATIYVAVIEMAAASGLGLVGEAERDAMAASSAGTGELIVAALAQGGDDLRGGGRERVDGRRSGGDRGDRGGRGDRGAPGRQDRGAV